MESLSIKTESMRGLHPDYSLSMGIFVHGRGHIHIMVSKLGLRERSGVRQVIFCILPLQRRWGQYTYREMFSCSFTSVEGRNVVL